MSRPGLIFFIHLMLTLSADAAEPGRQQDAIRLALAGDVMLARGVNQAIRTKGPDWPWGDVQALLRNADLAIANLECVLGRKGNEFMPRRVFYFRAGTQAAEALHRAGIDAVSLANNHALDYRADGLRETRRLLAQRGIAFAGAGEDLQQTQQIAWLEAGGMRIVLIAFADHFREYAATNQSAGINYIQVSTEPARFAIVKQLLAGARSQGADLIIFSMHWGPNMNRIPLPGFRDFAHAVIDAGADIFHGHSAHIFQGIEFYKRGVILYDTGDLVDDYYVYPQHQNDQQLLFLIEAAAGRIIRLELIPLKIAAAQVNHARGPDYDQIYQRISDLSRAFNTDIKNLGSRLIATPAQKHNPD